MCDRTDLFGGRALIFAISPHPEISFSQALERESAIMELSEKVKEYARSINASWRKSTDSVIETARLCADADKKLKPSEKSKLFDVLAFNKATFSKLAKIGAHSQLLSQDVRPSLPPSYTILYEVAKLTDDEFKLAIKERVINANMTRADLERWVAERKGEVQLSEDEKEKYKLFATLRAPSSLGKEREEQLEKALDELMKDFGIAVQRPRNLESDAMMRIVRKVNDHIRKGARQYIRYLKSARLGDRSNLSASDRKKLWGYSDDELTIDDNATWDRIEDVLELVGASDQFERLRDEALRLHGVSENTVRAHRDITEEQAMAEIEEIVRGLQSRDTFRFKPEDLSKFS